MTHVLDFCLQRHSEKETHCGVSLFLREKRSLFQLTYMKKQTGLYNQFLPQKKMNLWYIICNFFKWNLENDLQKKALFPKVPTISCTFLFYTNSMAHRFSRLHFKLLTPQITVLMGGFHSFALVWFSYFKLPNVSLLTASEKHHWKSFLLCRAHSAPNPSWITKTGQSLCARGKNIQWASFIGARMFCSVLLKLWKWQHGYMHVFWLTNINTGSLVSL